MAKLAGPDSATGSKLLSFSTPTY